MAPIQRRIGGLAQLFRAKPVASWGGAGFLLGAALAVATAGTDLNLLDGGIAFVGVLLAQGFVSHGLNDAYDWITGTDRESIGKGTGGSRVIPEGKLSVVGTILASMVALVAVMVIGWYFYFKYGLAALALLAIALWSPLSYSLPPLKLGYRPFNEILVVMPAIVGVVVGTEMVLTGGWSWTAVVVGWVHAMFCISWFIVSRVPDYEPDRRVGKITSVVYVGRNNAKLLSASYLALALVPVVPLIREVSLTFVFTPICWAVMSASLSRLDPYDEINASHIRLQNMQITTWHAVVLSLALVVGGV